MPSAHARSAALVAAVLLASRLASRSPALLPGPPRLQPAISAPGRRASIAGALLPALVAASGTPEAAAAKLTAEERRQVSLFQTSSPSVVGLGDAARAGRGGVPITGSAFVWDKGHVVTNFHVIAEMSDPTGPLVTFLIPDETDQTGDKIKCTVRASLVGADPLSDIAILEVPALAAVVDDDGAQGLLNVSRLMRPLQRGSSRSLVPGQEVFALGNPYGLEQSMSRGVISGVSRTMNSAAGRPMSGIIQTDASINPGNSGGPLLDSDGKVVGINTAILSTTGAFAGVGMAVPIDTVAQHVGSLLEKGFVSRATLGVSFAPVSMSKALGIEGLLVSSVIPGGPASEAGLIAMRRGRLGDVVVGIEGKRVDTPGDVVKLLDQYSPGKTVRVQLQRANLDLDGDDYSVVDLTVTLGAMNSPRIKVVGA